MEDNFTEFVAWQSGVAVEDGHGLTGSQVPQSQAATGDAGEGRRDGGEANAEELGVGESAAPVAEQLGEEDGLGDGWPESPARTPPASPQPGTQKAAFAVSQREEPITPGSDAHWGPHTNEDNLWDRDPPRPLDDSEESGDVPVSSASIDRMGAH